MKKLITLCLALAGMVGTVSARIVYFFPGPWEQGATNETFAVNAYDTNDTQTTVVLSKLNDGPYYSAIIDDNTVKINFVRYDGSKNFDWNNNKWNQTDDFKNLVPSSSAMYYVLNAWHIDENDQNSNSACFEITATLKGDFDNWGAGLSLTMTSPFVYSGTFDLTSTTADEGFKLVIRGDNYFGFEEINGNEGKLYLDSSNPVGWLEDAGTSNNANHNIKLKHSNTIYSSYNITATWDSSVGGYNWWKGWTLAISGKEKKKVPVSVGDKGYATFSFDKAVTIPADGAITAYRADHVNANGEIVFKKVSGNIPAGAGLLLMSEAESNNSFDYAESGYLEETNLMVGTPTESNVEASTNGSYNYMLSYTDANGIGFYYVNAPTTSSAGKAYLHTETPLANSSSARANWIFDNNDATSIKAVKNIKNNNEIYNLNGQRVNNVSHGMYIVNGKKVIK